MKTERNLVGFRSVFLILQKKNLITSLSKGFIVLNHIFGYKNSQKITFSEKFEEIPIKFLFRGHKVNKKVSTKMLFGAFVDIIFDD